MSDVNGSKQLYRTRDGRIVAGVCSGMGQYFGIDPNFIRLAFIVLAVFTGGVGALAYLGAWVLIPEEGEKSSIAENLINKGRNSGPGAGGPGSGGSTAAGG